MRSVVRFALVLLTGLAPLALAGYVAFTRATRELLEDDLAARSTAASAALSREVPQDRPIDPERLRVILNELTREERVMGAAVCSRDEEVLAVTAAYPSELSCGSVLERMRHETTPLAASWSTAPELLSGRVYVNVSRFRDGTDSPRFLVLVHDLSYLGRLGNSATNMAILAFFALCLGASLVTWIAARFAWGGWTPIPLKALADETAKGLQPLVHDVRTLADRLARGGPWSRERLRTALGQYLQGDRVVILANREPYIHEHTDDGVRVVHPASGLVTALEPVMQACSGVWVAHGSGSADRETVDARDHVRVPPGEESYVVRRVWLSDEEENGYYYGFSNEGLWPLCHVADARPVFRNEDWEHYVRVNQKFADAVCEEVDSEDPIVLVQDYHFALAPRMIRDRFPRATIITFWHIPWPSAERVGICPWREELITGLLGSSIVGFHTQQHCNNFIEAIDAFIESRIDREANAIIQGQHKTLVRPYPISIEWPVHWLDQVPPVEECRASVRRELGLPDDALLGVGVDRLDYTKGIEERLSAVDELLAKFPEFRGKFTFAQLAAPSRTKIPRYRELNDRVEALAAEINTKWGTGDYKPIALLRSHHEPAEVFRYYRASDLCYVSSLHDGMNLVAKEFVAAREDERGVLVLSQFTGASRDLTEALVVNPYDLRQASEALATALKMPVAEQRERMQSMRRLVSEFNVYRWAGRMLFDAAELRRKGRISDRISNSAHPRFEET